MPDYQVLRCCSCGTFQVQQVKKVMKWECKLCGQKQTILKVYGRGTGIDCRKHVQKLNLMRASEDKVIDDVVIRACDVYNPKTNQAHNDGLDTGRWQTFLPSCDDYDADTPSFESDNCADALCGYGNAVGQPGQVKQKHKQLASEMLSRKQYCYLRPTDDKQLEFNIGTRKNDFHLTYEYVEPNDLSAMTSNNITADNVTNSRPILSENAFAKSASLNGQLVKTETRLTRPWKEEQFDGSKRCAGSIDDTSIYQCKNLLPCESRKRNCLGGKVNSKWDNFICEENLENERSDGSQDQETNNAVCWSETSDIVYETGAAEFTLSNAAIGSSFVSNPLCCSTKQNTSASPSSNITQKLLAFCKDFVDKATPTTVAKSGLVSSTTGISGNVLGNMKSELPKHTEYQHVARQCDSLPSTSRLQRLHMAENIAATATPLKSDTNATNATASFKLLKDDDDLLY